MSGKRFEVRLPAFADRTVIVSNYGARPFAYTYSDAAANAQAINKAITYISEKGGGKVVIPKGIWYCAPIELKSAVCLVIEKNAVLKFSKNRDQYPLIKANYEGQECLRTVSPISAENAINIAITGEGVIDGSGDEWRPVKQFKLTERQWQERLKKSQFVIDTKEGGIWFPTESAFLGNRENITLKDDNALEAAAEYYDFYRPVMVSLRHCKNILLEGVTFRNSPAWNIHPFFCKNLTVRKVTVNNPYYAQNGDGIDVESCKCVEIHHCLFETGDDAICIKSGKNAEARLIEGPCEDIYVHDCTVNEGHGGFVIGSEMSRGVRNVYVSNCTFIGTDTGIRMKSAAGRGGVVENIQISDINMVNIKEDAVIMTMSYVLNNLNRNEMNEAFSEEDIPFFRNIKLDGIHCAGAGRAVKIEPLKGRADTIYNVSISNSEFYAREGNEVGIEDFNEEATEYIIM